MHRGVASCYVFKSRLQEYAQKVGIPTPVYQTLKEGPSHEPVFKSTVIVNNTRYDSLPGFFNRKAAEQSAAEIALMEIHKSGLMTENMPTVPLNLSSGEVQDESLGDLKCTLDMPLAMPVMVSLRGGIGGALQYTVLPGKRKVKEPELPAEAVKKIKPKKANFKKWSKKRFQRSKDNQVVQSTKNETEVYMLEDASRCSIQKRPHAFVSVGHKLEGCPDKPSSTPKTGAASAAIAAVSPKPKPPSLKCLQRGRTVRWSKNEIVLVPATIEAPMPQRGMVVGTMETATSSTATGGSCSYTASNSHTRKNPNGTRQGITHPGTIHV
nr:PREDICTED: double-stranded RNA-binding protein 8-like [Musa acuminata subsp. malaccensis]